MNSVGDVYKELLELFLDPNPIASLRDEASKLQLVGEKIGKLIRVAIGFDLFDNMTKGEYAGLLLEDDEDFVD